MNFVGFPLHTICPVLDESSTGTDGQVVGDKRITLILDAKGCIHYCSSPKMFSLDENELQGQPVTMLIPGLPLRSRTPGYNVAYTRFAFDNGRWHRQSVKVSDKNFVLMDLMIRAIPVNHGYCLLVLLKPLESAGDRISARKPQLRYVPSQDLIRARSPREKLETETCTEPLRHEEPTLLRAVSGW